MEHSGPAHAPETVTPPPESAFAPADAGKAPAGQPRKRLEIAYVVVEIGKRRKILRAFRDEDAAKHYLNDVNEVNVSFANPPTLMIQAVELY